MSVLIALDAGHGMNTAGKRTPVFPDGQYKGTFMHEREFNVEVINLLATKLLNRGGFRIFNVSPEDTDVPLKTRTDRANSVKADYFISVHANAVTTNNTNRDVKYYDFNTANGVETFIYNTIKEGSETYRFGESVHKYLAKNCGRRDRGLKKEDHHITRETTMSAVLVECGFMTNYEEANLLKTTAYREKCATGIYQGICSFLNVSFDPVVVLPPTIGEPPKPQSQHWGEPLIQRLIKEGIIGSYHNPTDIVTWGELSATVLNLYDKNKKER